MTGNMRMQFVVLLIVVCKCVLAFETINKQFSSYSYEEGVYDKDVFDFVEYNHHMWVHTGKHVYRLEGDVFKSVRFSKEENRHQEWRPKFSVLGDWLVSLNRKGLYMYDSRNDEFRLLNFGNGNINAISHMNDSLCLIATDQGAGLAQIVSDSIKMVKPLSETRGTITRVIKYVNGDLLVGSNDGVFHYQINGDKLNFLGHYLSGYVIEDATLLSDGSIWAGTSRDGLFVKTRSNKEFQKIEDAFGFKENVSSFIRSIIEHKNQVWIATFDGVYIFDQPTRQMKWLGKPSLNANSIFGLMFDSQDNIWIGGRKSGVNVSYRHNRVFKADGAWQLKVRDIQVSTFCEDAKGNYWVSTIGQPILYKYNSFTKSLTRYTNSDPQWSEMLDAQVKVLFCDSKGTMWCGTDEKGLFKFNNSKQAFDCVVPDSLLKRHHSAIEFLQEDRKGNLILGQYTNGVYRIEKDQIYRLTRVLKSAVSGMCRDESGRIWISSSNRIYTWDGDQMTEIGQYSNYGKLGPISVSNNQISVGLDDTGLLLIDMQDKSVRHMMNPFKSEYNNILSLSFDKMNRLWLASLGGMSVYEPGDSSFVNFRSNLFHGCGQYSGRVAFEDRNSRIWFGGESGLQVVNVEEYFKPQLQFLSLKADSSFESVQDSIFHYDDKVDIDLTILSSNYDKNLEVRYEMMLEPEDTVWRECSRRIELRNLIDAEYRLQVRATIDNREFKYAKPIRFIVTRHKSSGNMIMLLLICLIGGVGIYILIIRKRADEIQTAVTNPVSEDTTPDENATEKVIEDRYEIFDLNANVSESDREFLDKLLDVLYENYNNPEFSIEHFEKQMSLGHATFYRRLKSIADITAANLIRKYRLSLAKDLLMKSGNVSDTAYAVGFNDPKYFSRCFKQEFGVSPKVYMTNGG